LTYSIRPMTKADLAQVSNIDREAFPTQWPPPNYRQELQNKVAYYIVGCDDSRTMEVNEVKPRTGLPGLISRIMPLYKRRFNLDATLPEYTRQYIFGFSGIWVLVNEAHITNIALRLKYQGRGLGELLLIATIDLARELNASMMTLEVRASNQIAQNLYKKYGFVQAGLRRGYYLDNHEDAVIMSTESITATPFQARLKNLREALYRKLDTQVIIEGETLKGKT
jgi:ribosomal-protein-alanine N-acetyltransferase